MNATTHPYSRVGIDSTTTLALSAGSVTPRSVTRRAPKSPLDALSANRPIVSYRARRRKDRLPGIEQSQAIAHDWEE